MLRDSQLHFERLSPLARMLTVGVIVVGGSLVAGLRGSAPADRDAVIDRVLRLAQLISDWPSIAEIEINPLRVMRDGAVAIDVRVRVTRN